MYYYLVIALTNINSKLTSSMIITAQHQAKHIFKLTFVQQPTVSTKNYKDIIVALSLLGKIIIHKYPQLRSPF